MMSFLEDPTKGGKYSATRVGSFMGWLIAGGIAAADVARIWKGIGGPDAQVLMYAEYVWLFLGAAVTGKLVQRGIEANEKKAAQGGSRADAELGNLP